MQLPTNVQHLETEQKIIHLMLKHLDSIQEIIETGDVMECFSQEHKNIVSAIFREYINSKKTRKLSREAYAHFLKNSNLTNDFLNDLHVYDQCLHTAFASQDDIGMLKTQMFENFVSRQSNTILADYKEQIQSKGYVAATTLLADRLTNSLKLTRTRTKINFRTLKDLRDEYISEYEYRRDHPEHKITCGLPEIDDSMGKGFKPMHLTLFVADVGGNKTSIMTNIGLNISDKGHNVMFIALEMPALDLVTRIVANRENLDAFLLDNPSMAPSDHIETLKKSKSFNNDRFAILDGSRFTVSDIENIIEKYSPIFKPKVVIVDYVSIVKPEKNFNGRNDLEIGETLKSLRFLGQKYDFHIITAAQMGRATIKALRENKDEAVDSTSISGSHQYSADSDTIFALIKIPNETDRIKVNVIKARHGPSGTTKELRVDPARYRITSTQMSQSLIDNLNNNLEDELNIPIENISAKVKNTIDFAGMDFGDEPSTPKANDNSIDDDLSGLGL